MKQTDLENQLKQAVSYITPDLLEEIQERCQQIEEDRVEPIVIQNQSNYVIGKILKLVAMIALFVSTCIGIGIYEKNHVVASVIILEVNTSVHIFVDEDAQILYVESLNEQGEKLLQNRNFKGMSLEEVVKILTNQMISSGEIDAETRAIVIGVEEEEEIKNNAFQQYLVETIGPILQENHIEVQIVSQSLIQDEELRTIVNQYGVGFVKAEMMRTIANQTWMYTMEELSAIDEAELHNRFRPYIVAPKTEEQTEEEYITKYLNCCNGRDYEIIEKAYAHAIQQGVPINKWDIEIGLGGIDPRLCNVKLEEQIEEEQEEKRIYEYEIDIITKEMVTYEVDVVPVVMDYEEAWYVVRTSGQIPEGEACRLYSHTFKENYKGYRYEFKFETTNYFGNATADAKTGKIIYFELYKRRTPNNNIIETIDADLIKKQD